ncbi:MAG: PAS domain-containing sensor histidine kinase [Phormidium sp. GEM2.Bin31]|nr:PAS domain-containing protein [Phormidium sp. BM_Day4_Bin.17]TVR14000.1 MAG: PAS domain-containing sensor histidine kinase [Phormidium sp. GEM2.Bin31]UCJ11817.1 MAG: PAS domain-containing protein [Phormidium sp. PBR-2020]
MNVDPLNQEHSPNLGKLAQLSLDRMADAVLLTDVEARIFYANDAACRLLGCDRRDLLEARFWEIDQNLTPDTWPRYLQTLQNKGVLEQEARYRTNNQKLIEVEITATYLVADDQAYNCTVFRYLSERASVAREVQRAKDQLRAVLDAVPGLVSWISQDGRYLGVNRHLAASYNMPPDAFVGKELGFLKNSPEFVEFVRDFLQGDVDYHSQLVQANVRGIPCYYITAAQKYDQGRATVVVGVDVSERKRSEEALQRSEARLLEKTQELEEALRERQRAESQLIQSEKMYALGQMVAGMAHEINNPINFIYGNLAYTDNYVRDLLDLFKLYQEEVPDTPPRVAAEIEAVDLDFITTDLPKIVDSMKLGAERILKLVLSLRNFSRLDEAQFKQAYVQDGIESALAILNHRIQGRIELVKEYQPLPKIYCYPAQLNQVWMNLLCNAIDAVLDPALRDDGSNSQPRITIRTKPLKGDRVLVTIHDNGRGIKPELQEKIFDPFFTTKPVGTGTGLGLSICYQILQTHNGKIRVRSHEGRAEDSPWKRGSEFLIELPVGSSKDDAPR